MTERTPITIRANGLPRAGEVEPRRLLADFLRDDLGLTGTHLGCEHGVCGACTVLLNGVAVRSCLLFAVQADDCDVRTVEGLSENNELHPLQRAISDQHGLQCGFCTPGVLMAALDLLHRNPSPDEAQVRAAMAGNLCRCTGYDGIVRAVLQAAKEFPMQTSGT